MKEKMERWLLFTASVLVVVCASLMITPVECKKSKHISVKLNSKWGSTPLLLETSEFLAKEGEDQFWSYVESIVALDSKGYDEEFEEEMYHLGIKMASKLLTPLQMNLLKFSISLRSNSPAVEMFNHMAHDKKPPGDCESFVEINNMITCVQEAMLGFIDLAEKQPQSMSIKSDHHYPGSKGRPVVVVLYSQIGKQSFNEWHTLLKKLAIDGKIDYILRHYIKESAESRVRLSGYGVELAIKSTEYKAKDDTKVEDGTQGEDEEKEDDVEGFVFSKLKELHPNMRDSLKEFRQYLVDNQADLAPMKVWQLQDLSYQAAEKIMSSDDKLKTLRDVSQNFPVQAKALSRITVSKNLKSEIQKNQKVLENSFGVSPGESSLFINGLQADLDIYDVFTLLETMKSEAKLMEGLHALGKQYNLATEDMSKMQQIDLKDADTNYAVDCRDDSIVWLNNLEKDRKYQTWPSSVQEILRPTFPGMLRHIRRNLFNAIFFVNPVDKRYMELLKMAEAFYVHNAPTRIGLVFVVNNDPEVDGLADPGVAMLRAFNYIRKNDNVIKALSFITDLYEAAQEGQITIEFVLQEFVNAYDAEPGEIFGQKSDYDELRLVYERVKEDDITSDVVLDVFKAKFPKAKHEKVYDSVSEYDLNRQEGYEFFERTGLGQLPQVLMNGVPMKKDELGADEFEEAIVSAILKQTTELQKSVYHGFIYDGQDIFEHLMTRSNVMPRLNSRVLNPGEKYLDLSKDMPGTVVENPEAFKLLSPSDMSAALASNLHYVAKKEEEILRPVTNWIVADVNTKEGRALLYEGIKQLKHTNSMRLGLIHNPAGEVTEENSFISQAVQVSLETLPVAMAKSFITKLLKEDYVEALAKGSKPLEDLAVNNMDFASYDKALKERKIEFYASHQAFCQKALDFEPGQMGVISNGRIIGPFKEGELFVQQDFSLLDKFMYKTSAEKIEEKLKPLELEPATASDLLLKVSTLLASVPHKDSRKEVPLKHLEHSVIQIPPRNDGPAYDIVAILDPSSKAAQKYTPLIMVLQEVANVNIKVFLNCRDKLSEMPLKSFYRYVLEPEVRFSVDSKVATGPVAQFDDMPEQPILTLGMDPPESWLVEAIWSPHDLDNIHLSEVQKAVSAVFELEHLLVEGHCYDSNSGQPPRGLQFTLGTDNNPAQLDTIVMANLGYFQLKASPGAWNLKLRAGRSNEIYNIASHDYTDSPPDSPDVVVVIDNFKSKIIKVRVNKKAGKETEDLLSDDKEEPQGLWDSISNTITGKAGGTAEAETDTDQTINIFTLASGHLYERLLRIMIVSVMSTTKSNVKFWFLKNYLSPTFKDFIPHLAQEYGFEYELVQYKWPRWLHQQTEKQRVIWGYKILFLDVLFPLNVNKIIFVDADQIVRSDLQELVDLDLEGAPYGYTPFCDSRTEMDGFRFWRSGYWASHLAGRKYHISALYVVDLKKFRKIAAGDRLRGQYQGLSQDPNSLSNLDQDLPNNMIHQVNIKSLPQEWLWCETWCSDKEKASAKTIDLCNNPLTKEPKLTAAARIVPEWTDYDLKIKALWDKTYKKKDGDTSKSTPEKEDEPDKPDSEKPTPHGEL